MAVDADNVSDATSSGTEDRTQDITRAQEDCAERVMRVEEACQGLVVQTKRTQGALGSRIVLVGGRPQLMHYEQRQLHIGVMLEQF